ncbi:hypothetical protein A8B75_19275 [Sphingomonadales bacterium EhC05]|nr:hypothetical protein A8B75_19275 [Sphingomonadales bacterium EhC05]
MTVSEYIILFSSILIGLAIADLSLSLHKMLRYRKRIRWNLIVPTLGFVILCSTLNLWWSVYQKYSALESISFVEFLPQVLILVTFFLLSASVFPDEKPEEGFDLQDFYIENRAQFWGLFSLFLFLMVSSAAITAISENWSFSEYIANSGGGIIALVLALFLTKTRRMIFHWLAVAFLLFSIGNIWFYLVLA